MMHICGIISYFCFLSFWNFEQINIWKKLQPQNLAEFLTELSCPNPVPHSPEDFDLGEAEFPESNVPR